MNSFSLIFKRSREAAARLTLSTDAQRSEVLLTLADLIDKYRYDIIQANSLDLLKMDKNNPLYDRLLLNENRLDSIANDLRAVASLESPVGEVLEHRTLANGIDLKKVRVPFGVVGVIYEARPNVTVDVFSLCLKSGNVAILKGGSDAENSNNFFIKLIKVALSTHGLDPHCCNLLPSTHEATAALLGAVGYVDVCIPRGGKGLIQFVRDNAKVPVIETGAGVVHTYFDKDGDLSIGIKVIENGKTRRVSVCNALDSLLIHRKALKYLPDLLSPLSQKSVELYADKDAYDTLKGVYPADLLHHSSEEDKDKEWMDLKMGVYTVNDVDEAIVHISLHGSGHSESIVTENTETANKFSQCVDAACVYVNLPTSFTDGGQFGLGAEIGISTQKLGPRGPMGLREITTYKHILEGEGQTRP